MTALDTCRNCEPPPLPGADELDGILARFLVRHRARRASETQAFARLEVCHACDKCLGGHTCTVCGCLLAVKARVLEADCPHAEGDRWVR